METSRIPESQFWIYNHMSMLLRERFSEAYVMTNNGSVNCPQGRRVITRRAEQTKWRKSARWKKLVDDHARYPHAECSVCHRKHGQVMTDRKGNIKYDKKGNEKKVVLTINHTDRI